MDTCAQICVVATEAWPSSSWICRSSARRSSRWVAQAWRGPCGVSRLSMHQGFLVLPQAHPHRVVPDRLPSACQPQGAHATGNREFRGSEAALGFVLISRCLACFRFAGVLHHLQAAGDRQAAYHRADGTGAPGLWSRHRARVPDKSRHPASVVTCS